MFRAQNSYFSILKRIQSLLMLKKKLKILVQNLITILVNIGVNKTRKVKFKKNFFILIYQTFLQYK